ncbi:unnamed protein product [Dovyalis caffra]|uniref:AB hydrolase-1 domain-containing protein n=1 Tax=Dovyalis caffra TaxID=77055 RepID=A0AAV1RAZ2_9ROSI|nr:unnamed protein product [Dovyalis caffra]
MVNTLSLYKPLLHGLIKLAVVRAQAVEIEPGTVINFWLPNETTTKNRPAVVFLHGFGFDGILTWQFQVLALAKKYAVYVPDFLFFGDSITDKTERSPAFQAECMAKGLRKLGVEKYTLVGLSCGGMVGFMMAEMFPNLVESMVITCSVMALTESTTRADLIRDIILDGDPPRLIIIWADIIKDFEESDASQIVGLSLPGARAFISREGEMVNTLSLYKPLLHGLMKLAGVRPQAVEIEPGTVINFWLPNETTAKNRPAVVFLHGFGFDGILTWQFQVLALAKKYAVYVPDFLFFGDSITDKTERSPAFQAECMAKGLGKLGVEKCTLVGLSYGGMVGFKMAQMFPNLVESMVITCSVMALTESITRAGQQRIGFSSWSEYLIPETVKGVKKLLDIAFYKLPWVPDFVYKDILEALYFDHRKERHELLEALIVKDKDFTVPHFTQRIHLLWGGDDIIFDMEEVRDLIELLEGKATLHCIERAGHVVELERPFVYNRQLKNILASLYVEGQEN